MKTNCLNTARSLSNPLNDVSVPIHISGTPILASLEVKLIGTSQHWHIAEEVPVAIVYNRRNYAVMMASPMDVADFVMGFSLTERVVTELSQIKQIDIRHTDQGVDCRLTITDDRIETLDIVQRRRNLIGSASCGLCGLENADTLFETLPTVSPHPVEISQDAMQRAMAAMKSAQTLNMKTRSVHAAAWVSLDGAVISIREDVGRHNALDKLLGALARDDVDMQNGFVLMSSRCSYELVEKAARRGVTAMLSISGPTAFALRKAKSANMSLYARVIKSDGHVEAVRLT